MMSRVIAAAWTHVWLQVVGTLWFVASHSVQSVECAATFSAHSAEDMVEGTDDTISLLQVATAAQRSMPTRTKDGGNDIIAEDQDRDDLGVSAHLGEGEQSVRRKRAFRSHFIKDTSSVDKVWNFFRRIGDEAVGMKMRRDNIDGSALYNMSASDLRKYGLNEYRIRVVLDRIWTAKAQPMLRKSLTRMARARLHYTGDWTLHDIVGPDGVLMITLDREIGRFKHSAKILRQIGVNITRVSAVDSANDSAKELNKGCFKQKEPKVKEWCEENGRSGKGCEWPSEQAVTASHRKALEIAKERAKRGQKWTLILEDDAIPAEFENWNRAFRELWRMVPPRVKFLRLGWCQVGTMDWKDPIVQVPFVKTSDAILVDKETCCGDENHYDPGGCTTAYMVHEDILDDILNLFPCCGPVDSCYKWDYFKKFDSETRKERGLKSMMSVDSHNWPLWDSAVEQHGFILQDRETLHSSQDMWNR
mmetsp:Transcript_75878/g.143024  ORF Transcript_75878/g.143024 Transcript_75878/m.143024 type:complete len:475 (-) Transcript_75878:28-1452(-)